jgi:formylglycine-generating enzyme required for sulfatase activity
MVERSPHPQAPFTGSHLPRTRVSWFDGLAFCFWLAAWLKEVLLPKSSISVGHFSIRLPTEQEWQRAALGDTGWPYPWGEVLAESRGNYGGRLGQPSRVEQYPAGQSVYGVMDLTGNVWEWCLTGWNQEEPDVNGYTARLIKGGAWNIANPDHLRSNDRGCHPPRGRFNDCGLRPLLCWNLPEET